MACAWLTIALMLTGAGAEEKTPLDLDAEQLQRGLVAVLRSSVDDGARLTRVDAKPAFFLDRSSPHPRLPAGPFEATWTGVVLLKDDGPIAFNAFLGGDIKLDVAGVTVLHGTSRDPSKLLQGKVGLQRPAGLYTFRLHFKSLPKTPARLQLFWQGPTFDAEPIPAWYFWHHRPDDPPELAREALVERGRALVARLGCARCHQQAFPGMEEPPPGPALADLNQRVDHSWLVRWLDDPTKLQPDSRMPRLFTSDRHGFVERWLVATYLVGARGQPASSAPTGDHREGRKTFVGIGCFVCHPVPDQEPLDPRGGKREIDEGRWPLRGLGKRFSPQHVAAYLLLWSKDAESDDKIAPPSAEEVQQALARLGARDEKAAGVSLLQARGCVQCHPGLGNAATASIAMVRPAGGCLTDAGTVRFALDKTSMLALTAYLKTAAGEKHAAPFFQRQRALQRAGCVRCHQRDTDKPPPLERLGSTLGGAFLHHVPFQKAPRLTQVHLKYQHDYLAKAVREGVSGIRADRFSFRMPSFGKDADMLVQALAEADGIIPGQADPEPPPSSDPTLGSLSGPLLAGFQGYACVSCHVWNGKLFAQPDPGAVGTELTRVVGRIRRDWFDRFLDGPARFHPGTPMPAIFTRGKPATLRNILEGDPARQKDALWSYFALGPKAPSPKPPPPLVIAPPDDGKGPLVAQLPIHVGDNKTPVEAIVGLFDSDDILLYDLETASVRVFTGAHLLRKVEGRLRTFIVSGTPVSLPETNGFVLTQPKETPTSLIFLGFTRLPDGLRADWKLEFTSATLTVADTVRLVAKERRLVRDLRVQGLGEKQILTVAGLTALEPGKLSASHALPPRSKATPVARTVMVNPEPTEGSRERPGYRAVLYARPKSPGGEDLLMPAALAVHPRDGRVFVASMKMGEIFVLRPEADPAQTVKLEDYARGLFQEAYSLCAEEDALYVLHRRNLTKIVDTAGQAERFERVVRLPHGVGDTYDYAYGLVRDSSGAFVYSFAPHANRKLAGSGSALHLVPGQKPRVSAFGFRNPIGWCVGPDHELFFTDNQGEWVATNKLCHLQEGKFFGYPNGEQKEHVQRPRGKAAIWVPYGWARSINGVAYDHTGGKFGPFGGQIFLAELMYGGGIVRANLEKINGQYQGACFPFWGKGLLGPVTLAFAPTGPLYVGSITEPGWMAQPDRGALYRIDFTGATPFEMKSIHARPRGFRILFTTPIDPRTARAPAAFAIEHYRYEYTGSYGSPELDRTKLAIQNIDVAADGMSVELTTAPLAADRVYMISAAGVRSPEAARLVHATGAYTLNEIPR